MKCGVSSCRYKAKNYGVCGVHKKWAFTSSDKNFNKDLKVYRKLFENYLLECAKLEAKGLSIMQIQSSYNYNLCGPAPAQFPAHLEGAGLALEKLNPQILAMQQIYDTNLVSNAVHRVGDSLVNPNCGCPLCSLGTVTK